jgi:predicted kinase
MNRSKLIILCGISGSGKSTYAKDYIERNGNAIRLSSDAVRKELYGDENIQGNPGEVFTLMQKRAVEALNNGYDVIYDCTNITRKDRAGIINVCPKFAKIECHIIWAPIEVCIQRDAERERTVGKEVIDRMLKRFQAPYYDEGIDDIFIEYSIEDFDSEEYLQNTLSAMKIPHDNSHHTLNIFDHCITAGKYVHEKKNGCDPIWLATALHDIGKPYVKSFVDSKGNPCEQAHYYQHQCVSAWMCYGMRDLFMWPWIVYPKVAWLISTHMEPFFNSKYYKNLPPFLKKDIDLLHEADLAAH